MALAFLSAQFTETALPFIRTTMSGLPVALTASSSCSSSLGRSRLVTITTFESLDLHIHLFAFEVGGDAYNSDDQIGFLRSGDRILNGLLNQFSGPHHLCDGIALRLKIFYFERVLVPLFEFYVSHLCGDAVGGPIFDDQLSVKPQTEAVVRTHAKLIGTGFRGSRGSPSSERRNCLRQTSHWRIREPA